MPTRDLFAPVPHRADPQPRDGQAVLDDAGPKFLDLRVRSAA
ncbi:hypothetical protein AB0G02_31455 [Actinosynnema sp. NPDC023658]